LFSISYRSGEVTIQPYDGPSATDPIPVNHTVLFNSMIYPFTRIVIYGVIWYQGEGNCGSYGDTTYVCSFSKMIETWRQIWNQRTNGITDIQFPFGFVQVNLKNFILTWTD
jgi:sialate O-acetylesterase